MIAQYCIKKKRNNEDGNEKIVFQFCLVAEENRCNDEIRDIEEEVERDRNPLGIEVDSQISTGKGDKPGDDEVEDGIIEVIGPEHIGPDQGEDKGRNDHGMQVLLFLVPEDIVEEGNHDIDEDDILDHGIK